MVFTQREQLTIELEAYNRIMDKYGILYMELCEIKEPTAGEAELLMFLKERLDALFLLVNPIYRALEALVLLIGYLYSEIGDRF